MNLNTCSTTVDRNEVRLLNKLSRNIIVDTCIRCCTNNIFKTSLVDDSDKALAIEWKYLAMEIIRDWFVYGLVVIISTPGKFPVLARLDQVTLRADYDRATHTTTYNVLNLYNNEPVKDAIVFTHNNSLASGASHLSSKVQASMDVLMYLEKLRTFSLHGEKNKSAPPIVCSQQDLSKNIRAELYADAQNNLDIMDHKDIETSVQSDHYFVYDKGNLNRLMSAQRESELNASEQMTNSHVQKKLIEDGDHNMHRFSVANTEAAMKSVAVLPSGMQANNVRYDGPTGNIVPITENIENTIFNNFGIPIPLMRGSNGLVNMAHCQHLQLQFSQNMASMKDDVLTVINKLYVTFTFKVSKNKRKRSIAHLQNVLDAQPISFQDAHSMDLEMLVRLVENDTLLTQDGKAQLLFSQCNIPINFFKQEKDVATEVANTDNK